MASVTLPPISPNGGGGPTAQKPLVRRQGSGKAGLKSSASSSSSGGSPDRTLSQRGLRDIMDESAAESSEEKRGRRHPRVSWGAREVGKGAPPVGTPLLRKRDRELLAKKETLRVSQPTLTRLDTAKYRNSYKHNLCLEMLQEGMHKSFAEIVNLMKKQQEAREKAGPDSALWMQPLLEEEHRKLDQLRACLTQAELARRRGLYEEVYAAQFELACFFQSVEDRWLADHFFEASLNTAYKIPGDKSRKKAEAHRNLGLSLEHGDDPTKAAEHLEAFHELCKDKNWTDREGMPYVRSACKHLCRIYTTIATEAAFSKEEENEEGDPDAKAIVHFIRAHEFACRSGDRETEGGASYRLGLAYERLEEHETAAEFLKTYLHICQATEDETGTGRALEALARCCEALGQMDETIDYLKRFAEVALRTKQEAAYSRACSLLSTVYNSLGRKQSMGDLEQSEEHFSRAYNTAKSRNDPLAVQAARTQYGVSCGQKLMENFARIVGARDGRREAAALVEWKNDRYVERKMAEELAEGKPVSTTVKKSVEAEVVKDVEGNRFDDFMNDWTMQEDPLFEGEGTLKHLINMSFAPFQQEHS